MIKLLSFLDRKITVRVPITIFIWLPALAYLTWEIYWCAEVGYAAIKWHTHLMPYLYLGFTGFLIFSFAYRRKPSNLAKNLFLLFGTVVFCLFMIESFLMISGTKRTYWESIKGYYVSQYTPIDADHYHLWPLGKSHWLTKPEYSYLRPTNSLGFADMEWTKERKGSEKRILTLGDSFTEGDGAPYDSSYVALMRGLLPEDSFYIMNGGICGSDPFNNFIILKDKLLPLKPDIIIQSVGSNDMTSDILIRGGLARFTKDGKQVWRPAPWWEPLYAGSYIFRVLAASVGYTEVLTKKTLNTDEQQRVNSETEDMFAKYSALCRSNHIQMIVILHPEKGELINNKYDYDFVPLVADLEKYGVKVIDLLPSYREYLERNHSDPKAYYWIYDGHHNSRGYKMMAESTLENIRPFLKDLNENSR